KLGKQQILNGMLDFSGSRFFAFNDFSGSKYLIDKNDKILFIEPQIGLERSMVPIPFFGGADQVCYFLFFLCPHHYIHQLPFGIEYIRRGRGNTVRSEKQIFVSYLILAALV